MFSKSSNNAGTGPLPVGKVRGHRGSGGEITVRIASKEAGRWCGLTSVLIERGTAATEEYEIESLRWYRDRLVLKLEGVESARDAAELKGGTVLVRPEQVPSLPDGEYYLEYLTGLQVFEKGRSLGFVEEILEAAGTHVLVVRDAAGDELLVPLVREMVKEVDQERSRIEVDLPEGLKEIGSPGNGGRT